MTVAAAYSDAQLIELMGLLGTADSVELKMTVPDSAQRSAAIALGLDPLDGQIRIVSFFDTPGLDLEAAGVVVRARRVQRKGDDTVVKLRPVDPAALPPEVRQSPDFVVEVDATREGFVCSGSLKGIARVPVRDVNQGVRPLRKVLTKEQRAFFTAHAPDSVTLDDLALLGPIFVLKLKGVPEGYNRKLVAELWLYPDGTRILELSTKCAPAEAFQVAAETRAFLAERDITPSGNQQTKTRKALSFFAKQLASAR